MLSTRSATALYVGAVLGPGVLIVPALAAQAAGPASLLAWVGLLALSAPLAATFAALGVRYPEAGGTAAYVRAAFGRTAGAVTGWWFLIGVVIGAPAVALAGGFYVAELVGTGREGAVVAGAGMMAVVAMANAAGLHATARLQLALAGVLAALLLVAVVSALPESRAGNWAPFAPHGWGAVGTAASLLMLSFIGWEAVSHLAGELRDPVRQLPRAIFAALGVVVVLYLGLAVATVGVLGTEAPSNVPLADLMGAGLGAPGRTGTAALAAMLTMGAMNAYVAAAVKLAGALAAEGSAPPSFAGPGRALTLFGAVASALLAALAADVLGLDGLIRATSAAFVAVYVTSTAAGVRLLDGAGRRLSAVSFVAVVVIFAFFGKYLLVPAAVALTAIAFSGVPRRLMTWFTEHDAPTLLRWVRRVDLAFVPFALVLAALLLAEGSGMWWIGCASAGLGLLAAAPMGAAIRRAEARADHDPDSWRDWARRAERLTAVAFAAVAALAVGLAFAFGGAGLAIMLAAMFATASGAASAVRRRAG